MLVIPTAGALCDCFIPVSIPGIIIFDGWDSA